jgi:hypothetical protein
LNQSIYGQSIHPSIYGQSIHPSIYGQSIHPSIHGQSIHGPSVRPLVRSFCNVNDWLLGVFGRRRLGNRLRWRQSYMLADGFLRVSSLAGCCVCESCIAVSFRILQQSVR